MKRLWRYSDLMVIENGSRLPSWIWTTIWQAFQPFSSFKHFIKHLSSAVNDAMSIYKWHNLWCTLVLFIQINKKFYNRQTNTTDMYTPDHSIFICCNWCWRDILLCWYCCHLMSVTSELTHHHQLRQLVSTPHMLHVCQCMYNYPLEPAPPAGE